MEKIIEAKVTGKIKKFCEFIKLINLVNLRNKVILLIISRICGIALFHEFVG